MKKRKIVVITARVHASETMSSFKVEAILKFLISKDSRAMKLRDLYVFKIAPMLNPEGVVCGNTRCTFMGSDLNRHWDNPNELLHTQIYYLKNLMLKLQSTGNEILLFCDLHGHDRELSSFMYGCNKAANGGFCTWTKVRLLPRILATKTPLFSYNKCRFRVEASRQNTGRVVAWREMGITNSFTFESSSFGYRRDKEIIPFQIADYYELGQSLLFALLEYHYVLKKLEKELIITRGWLKPSRLFAITSELTADILEKKILLEKKEGRKKLIEMSLQKKLNEKQGLLKKSSKLLRPIVNVETKSAITDKDSEEDIGKDWRDYFTKEELEQAYNKIISGIDPNDEKTSESKSGVESELKQIIVPKITISKQIIKYTEPTIEHTSRIQLKSRQIREKILKRNHSVQVYSAALDNSLTKQTEDDKPLRKQRNKLIIPIRSKLYIAHNIYNSKDNIRRYMINHCLPAITLHKTSISCTEPIYAQGKSLNVKPIAIKYSKRHLEYKRSVCDNMKETFSFINTTGSTFSEYKDLNEKYKKSKRLGKRIEDVLLGKEYKRVWEQIVDYKISN